MCYGETRFGRQKVPVNRKYGHDTQGVTLTSGRLVSGSSQDDERTTRLSLLGSLDIDNHFFCGSEVSARFTAARVQAVVMHA